MSVKSNPVRFLRIIGLLEAVSFLILAGIAMPLKYFAGMPGAIRIPGLLHGILFMVFCLALLRVFIVVRWPVVRVAIVFIAALLPFGPILLERRMKRYETEFEERGEGVL